MGYLDGTSPELAKTLEVAKAQQEGSCSQPRPYLMGGQISAIAELPTELTHQRCPSRGDICEDLGRSMGGTGNKICGALQSSRDQSTHAAHQDQER